jgi:hypothetical protein
VKPDDDKEFFLCTKDDDKNFVIFTSDTYKFSEFDVLNLIKICIIEQRSKAIGNKILEVYKDSTEHKKEIAKERLKKLGVSYDEKKPTIKRKPKTK